MEKEVRSVEEGASKVGCKARVLDTRPSGDRRRGRHSAGLRRRLVAGHCRGLEEDLGPEPKLGSSPVSTLFSARWDRIHDTASMRTLVLVNSKDENEEVVQRASQAQSLFLNR